MEESGVQMEDGPRSSSVRLLASFIGIAFHPKVKQVETHDQTRERALSNCARSTCSKGPNTAAIA